MPMPMCCAPVISVRQQEVHIERLMAARHRASFDIEAIKEYAMETLWRRQLPRI